MLPLGEFTAVIPKPHATFQGAVTWRNQCHDRATLQVVRIPSAILRIIFRHIFFVFFFKFNLGFDERGLSYRLPYTCFYRSISAGFHKLRINDFSHKLPHLETGARSTRITNLPTL